MRDRIFCHYGHFFAILPQKQLQNQNFEKMKKMPEDIIDNIIDIIDIRYYYTINDNHMMYGS